MNKLALFDIDHTLLKPSKVHHESFEYALREVYGIKGKMHDVNAHGLSDRLIAIKVLKMHGVKNNLIRKNLDKAMKVMQEYYSKNMRKEKLIVEPGVKKLLDALQKKGVMLGLITGNLQSIAMDKMRHLGFDKYFKFGGFGSDGTKRKDLVKAAIKRAKLCGFKKKIKNVFVFGDTPVDISAGKANKAVTLTVGTGHYSLFRLKKAGADFEFRDLTDTKKILDVIV
ncbi:HAD hydrolase-like protein [Candidatus Woesearchaeota archaeon]|nr:HAD hydrolase-like protein [Candidatus Woesearchaeota archaeon]